MTFRDGALILSQDQYSRLGLAMQIDASTLSELVASLLGDKPDPSLRSLMESLYFSLPTSMAPPVEPCAWNMMFSRRYVMLNIF